jgi:hypothetical protein
MSSDLLTSTIPYLAVIGISDALAFYAAYLSFSVWRGLSVTIYRSRALWTGMLAILIGLTGTASGNVGAVPQPFYPVAAIAAYGFLYPIAIFVLYFWIDRTLATIIRLDYLRRDLLAWRRFRFIYWAFAAASFVFYYFGQDYLQTLPLPSIAVAAFLITYVVPWGYAAVGFIVGRRRTSDMTFRLHLKWFGLFLASIAFITVIYGLTSDRFTSSLSDVLIAYSLYKMARYLVPSQRLKLDDNLTKEKSAGPGETQQLGAA